MSLKKLVTLPILAFRDRQSVPALAHDKHAIIYLDKRDVVCVVCGVCVCVGVSVC